MAMFAALPQQLREFRRQHRRSLTLILAEALPRYATAMLYALLAVVIAEFSNEAVAGIAFSAFALYELFISDPLGGALADRFGSRFALLLQAGVTFSTGLLLFFLPRTLETALLIGFMLFTCTGLRMIGAYLLRTMKRDEGGVVFGLSESLVSFAYFSSTLSIPFLARSERSPWIAVLLMAAGLLYGLVVSRMPDDRKKLPGRRKRNGYRFNPLDTVKHGIHFVHRNSYYPLMPLAADLFEGIFYSTIWFVFPLRFAKLAITGGAGLELGIYDLVTMLFAGVCGYLADRYNWRLIHSIGWLLVFAGAILLPIANASVTLILAGLVIAVGNNLSYFSAEHVLAKYDIDHREDGSFMALTIMLRSLGYVISPVIAGALYYRFGFSAAIAYACGLSGLVAIGMTWKTWTLELAGSKRRRRTSLKATS